jgi:hypothetical protein
LEPSLPEVAARDITSHCLPARGVIADRGGTKGWAAPPHWGGGSPVGAAWDTATIGPPSYRLGLWLAWDDTVNTLVSRTASATVSPARDGNSDTNGVSSCRAVATAAAAAEGGACAVHSARHVWHRVHGHTVVAVLRRPRPHANATPEGGRAAHWARALHVGFLHSMDGFVVRTLGSGSRVPQDFDLMSIVAASRSVGMQVPPGYGVRHGFVRARTPVRVTFTVLTIGGPHPQIKACGHSMSSRVILQRALSPPNGGLRILLGHFPRPYGIGTCFPITCRSRVSLLSPGGSMCSRGRILYPHHVVAGMVHHRERRRCVHHDREPGTVRVWRRTGLVGWRRRRWHAAA